MSWLPVANIQGVVDALASMDPKYTSQTNGLNLSKPLAGLAADGTKVAFLPSPDGSAYAMSPARM